MSFKIGEYVLLNTKNLPIKAVSAVTKTKLCPRYIIPFKVVAKKGLAYTLDIPKRMQTHAVFYVGLLKPYHDPDRVNAEALAPRHETKARPFEVDPTTDSVVDSGHAVHSRGKSRATCSRSVATVLSRAKHRAGKA